MSLTCVLRGESDQPLVLLHDSSGSTTAYQALVESLAWPGSTWLLQAPGMSAEEPAFAGTFEARAQRYAEDIADRCGAQAVRLAGWAMGGVLSAEIARALSAMDRQVSFVGVIDGRVPQPEMKTRPRDAESMARFFLLSTARKAGRPAPPIPSHLNADAIYQSLREHDALGEIATQESLARQLAVFSELAPSFMLHDMAPLDIDVDVFVSKDEDPAHPKPPTLGWEAVARSQRLHPIPGTHFTVLDRAFTEDLAMAMKQAILAREPNSLSW